MSPITIGLLGHNGLIGATVLQELAPLDASGKVHLVVIHRPASSTETIPAGIEKRSLDLTAADGPAYDEAVKGLQVVLSTVGAAGIYDQIHLVPALARSKDLVTFIPSVFSTPWTKDELSTMRTKFLDTKELVLEAAQHAGIKCTVLLTGLFPSIVLQYPFSGVDVKGNKILTYGKNLDAQIPYSTVPYIGKAVASLVQQPPQSYAGKEYRIIELHPTTREIAKTLTNIHGQTTELVEVSESEMKERLASDLYHGYYSLFAGLLRRAGTVGFTHITGMAALEAPGWKSEGLEAWIRKAMS